MSESGFLIITNSADPAEMQHTCKEDVEYIVWSFDLCHNWISS